MKLKVNSHRYESIISKPGENSFCKYCGIYISKNERNKMIRSDCYNIIDLYKSDSNFMLSEMIKKQNLNRKYNPKPSYVRERPLFIKLVKYIAEIFDCSYLTFYLSIAILDVYLSQKEIDQKKNKLICYLVIHVASKLEERSDKVKDIKFIENLFKDEFNYQDILILEQDIARSLSFNFNIKTPYVFVEFFLSKGVCTVDDFTKTKGTSINEKVLEFENIVMEYVHKSFLNYNFYAFEPLTIAVASLVCARRYFKFSNEWTSDLSELTRMNYNDVLTCVNLLFSAKNVNFGEENMNLDNSSIEIPMDSSSRCTTTSPDPQIKDIYNNLKTKDTIELFVSKEFMDLLESERETEDSCDD